MKMISEPKQKVKHSHLLVLMTKSDSWKEMEAVSDILLFLLRYSFLLNDATKPQNSRVQKTSQLNAPQGNIYMGARYLDPKYSRWISTDPALGEYIPSAGKANAKDAGNLPGMGGVFNHINGNLYHYAGNNPVRYTDPDGRQAEAAFDYEYFYNNLKLVEEALPELKVFAGGGTAAAAAGAKGLGKTLVKAGTAFFIFFFCLTLQGSTIEPPKQEAESQKLSPEEAKALIEKMSAEIQGIMSKPRGNDAAEVYALVAKKDGHYPNLRTGELVYLKQGDVWKYGQTSNSSTRYPDKNIDLNKLGLDKVEEFIGTKEECLIVEKLKIYGYYLENGYLPPGNKIFR